MKLAVGIAIGLAAGAARGDTFEEYGAGVPLQGAESLREASCALTVELRGAVAVVEQRQRIVNAGATPLAAHLEFELPPGARLIGFSVGGDAAVAVGAAPPSSVGATAATGVDPAIVAHAGVDRYRALLQPFAREVIATTRYVALARVHSSALHLTLPARAALGLGPCDGTIRATPGPGAAVRAIRVGGASLPGSARRFVVEHQDIELHVDLDLPRPQPIAWLQTQALADGWSASLVTVIAPAAKRATPRRVVFVIDGSRSMELVGRHNIAKVIRQLGATLPAGSDVEAIFYDRRATRLFGESRPATAQSLGAIEAAVGARAAANGSDLAGALALGKQAIRGARGQAMLVLITDGVTGALDGAALARAIDAVPSALDLHAIVLDPAQTTSPGGDALRAAIQLYGGAYVEVAVDQLDDALVAVDAWLRPGWSELALAGHAIPGNVAAGGGYTHAIWHRGAAPRALTGRGEAAFSTPAAAAPAAPIGALALELPAAPGFSAATLERALAAHPAVGATASLAVLATIGRVARSRRQMVAGGGRYDRIIAVEDPASARPFTPPPPPPGPSAIARATLERLFREQLQPRAYHCYQRALGRNAKLTGTVYFQLRMGRGEVTDVSFVGVGDPDLNACLVDAAYTLTPPQPDFTINSDDQTIANYPLTLQHRGDQAVIVLGDADSQSPLDIDAIEGGVPGQRPVRVAPPDASTPLGGLRPPPSP